MILWLVHRAHLEGKTSIMTFALGLLVLKEQIFLSEGMLQTLTLTLGWITQECTDKGLNADTAANARSKILDYSIIVYGGCCLFLWKALATVIVGHAYMCVMHRNKEKGANWSLTLKGFINVRSKNS